MINAKQTFLSLSLVLMIPVSAMQSDMTNQKKWLIKTMGVSEKNATETLLKHTEESYGKYLDALARLNDPQGTKQTRSKADVNLRKLKQEIRTEIDEAEFVVPNMQPEEIIEVASGENLPKQQSVQISDVSQAIVLYRDSSEIINATEKAVKPVVFDVSLACELAQEMQLSSNESASLFSRIMSGNQNNSLSSAPKQNISSSSFNPEIIRFGQGIAQALEIDLNTLSDVDGNITLRDANGNIIAQVTDGDDIADSKVIEIPVDNIPGIEIIHGDNIPVIQAPVGPDAPKVHTLKALNKSLLFGLLGVCGVSALGWKLYQKTAHYQCGLLKKWQTQVAGAIAGITCGTKVSYAQMPAIELSQLTRLTDVEREQLAQAHNSLVMAFDKVQQVVATDAVSRNGQVAIEQIPVVKELKVAHAQWDNVMNDCKNVVEQGSMRLW